MDTLCRRGAITACHAVYKWADVAGVARARDKGVCGHTYGSLAVSRAAFGQSYIVGLPSA